MNGQGHSRSLVWLTLFALTGATGLIGLGAWQLQRKAWKESLIRAAQDRSAAPALPIPPQSEWANLDPHAVEYRRVRLAGILEYDKEVRVFTSLPEAKGPARGPGAWVLTPLRLDDGSRVIVNRGFVPASRLDPATRMMGYEPQDHAQTVVGLMRWREERNIFTPADDPKKGIWYTRDPQIIGSAKGLDIIAPFFVDAEESAPGGVPQGGETRLKFPNRHLEYALTWFGLAAALLGVFAAFVVRQRRLNRRFNPGGK